MTKKDTHKEEVSLEEQLEQLQAKKQVLDEGDVQLLQQNIDRLEKEKTEMTEITKRVQYDYLNLKTDFERFQRISAEKEKSMESDSLVKHFKEVLPVLNQLKVSLAHVDDEKAKDPFVLGVKMVYDNILKALEGLGIKPIPALGLEPDSFFHEPLSTIPVDNKKMKGKIIQEFQQGFYLEKDGKKAVILISKVVIGS